MRIYYIYYILYVVHTALTRFSGGQKLHVHRSRGLNGVVAVMVMVVVMEKSEKERERSTVRRGDDVSVETIINRWCIW